MNIQEENSALYFRVQSEREQTLGVSSRKKKTEMTLNGFVENANCGFAIETSDDCFLKWHS